MSNEIAELFGQLKLKYAREAYKKMAEDATLMASATVDDALMSILSAEIDGRADARRKMLLMLARIPVPADMRDVSYDDNRGSEFARLMARVRTMSLFSNGSNLCILGSSGSGKTFVASALAREAVANGYSTVFSNTRDLAARMSEKRAQGSTPYKLARERLARQQLLILDDFCLAKPTEDEIQSLFDIMNDRSGKHSTMVLSQKDHNRWLEEIGITAIGEAVVERIMAGSLTIVLGTGSRRRTLDDAASTGAAPSSAMQSAPDAAAS